MLKISHTWSQVATDLSPGRRTRRLATIRRLMATTLAEISFKINAVMGQDSEASEIFDTIRGDLVTAVNGNGDSPGSLKEELEAAGIGALDTDATLQGLEALSFATSATVIQVRKEDTPPVVPFVIAVGIISGIVLGVLGVCCIGIRWWISKQRRQRLEPRSMETAEQSLQAIDMPENPPSDQVCGWIDLCVCAAHGCVSVSVCAR